MSNYLRNRPFMVITYSYVLAPGQKSHTKGFMETAQWEPVEKMVIVDRVSAKQMQHSELVLDLFENKVVKCRDETIDHKKIFDIMVSRHFDEVKAALATWIARDPSNLEKVQAFIERSNKKPVTIESIETDLKDLVFKAAIFEPNNDETRGKVIEVITDYLGRVGVNDFTVLCDETNNTQERINANELWADAAVQLNEGDEFVTIAMRVTKEGADA